MNSFIKRIASFRSNIRRRHIFIGCIILVGLIGILVWISWPHQEYKATGMRPQWNVADNIVRASQSQIFATAVYNLGYTKFLSGEGPYTVFVPLDRSYNDLTQELKYLLADTKNEGSIRQTILYHVVPGRYILSDLQDGTVLTTVQGEQIYVTRYNGQIILNGSSYIEIYDIEAKNGIIHQVDGYLIPPSMYGNAQ